MYKIFSFSYNKILLKIQTHTIISHYLIFIMFFVLVQKSDTIVKEKMEEENAEVVEYSEEEFEGPLPEFTQKPEPASVKEGETIHLTCRYNSLNSYSPTFQTLMILMLKSKPTNLFVKSWKFICQIRS